MLYYTRILKKVKQKGVFFMKIYNKKPLGEGNWLCLYEVQYTDRKGVNRSWEAASRKNRVGAVLIIATLVPSGKLVLIRQNRPPSEKMVLEFPAGLVDPGETPEQAAVRELREETGYIGTITSITQPGFASPGMTAETVSIVKMKVLEADQTELKTDFDEAEDIETLLAAPEELQDLFAGEYAAGRAVDAKLLAYAAALCDRS